MMLQNAKPQIRTADGSDFEILDRAIAVPPCVTGFTVPAGLLRADGAPYQAGALLRHKRAITTTPEMPQGSLPILPGKWIWGGTLWQAFSHFVVESLGRLWISEVFPDVNGVLFIPRKPDSNKDLLTFQRDTFRAIGVQKPVHVLQSPHQVSQLVVAEQGFGLGVLASGSDAFRAFAARFGKDIAPKGAEKIYISRSALSKGKGCLIGEDVLEQRLAEEGYTIYHPQAHSIASQIAQYKAAHTIVAAEGSALHLLAFVARPHQRVAMVLRRQHAATQNIIEHLRSFAGIETTVVDHAQGYWAPRKDPRPRFYSAVLDLLAVQESLIAAGFLTAPARSFPPLSDLEIRQKIGWRYAPLPAD